MKSFFILISFIIALSLVSCEKQETQNFLKDIERKWELEKIVFGHNENDPVSTLNMDNAFLEFISCNIDDNMAGTGNCEAILELDGKNIDLIY